MHLSKSRTIRYLNQRTRRRKDASSSATLDAGPLMVALIALACMLFIWSMGAAVVSFNNRRTSSLKKNPFPRTVIDIWPDSMGALELFLDHGQANLLSSCLPQENPIKCRVLGGNDDANNKGRQQIIGVVRPPGRLGQIMETFVRSFVKYLVEEDSSSQLPRKVVASHLHIPLLQETADEDLNAQMPSVKSVTHIIRPAALPPLLEALDLILQTRDGHDKNLRIPAVSTKEVEAVLRQVFRWYCHVSRQATGRASLTLYIDEAIGYPRMGQASLTSFLDADGDDELDEVVVEMDPLAQDLFQRIEEATTLAERIFASSQYQKSPPANDWANQIIRNEWKLRKPDMCLSPLDLETVPLPRTRVTELVGAFLEGSSSATKEGCQKYPQSVLCLEFASDLSKR